MDSPVGAISVAKNAVREMLANCTAFRTFHGQSWTVAEARARIYFDTLPALDTILTDPSFRPLAIIVTGRIGYSKSAGPNLFVPSGSFLIELHDTPETIDTADPTANERRIENAAGLICQSGDANNPGLAELSNAGDYLPLTDIRYQGCERIDPQLLPTIGDAMVAYIELEWGAR